MHLIHLILVFPLKTTRRGETPHLQTKAKSIFHWLNMVKLSFSQCFTLKWWWNPMFCGQNNAICTIPQSSPFYRWYVETIPSHGWFRSVDLLGEAPFCWWSWLPPFSSAIQQWSPARLGVLRSFRGRLVDIILCQILEANEKESLRKFHDRSSNCSWITNPQAFLLFVISGMMTRIRQMIFQGGHSTTKPPSSC